MTQKAELPFEGGQPSTNDSQNKLRTKGGGMMNLITALAIVIGLQTLLTSFEPAGQLVTLVTQLVPFQYPFA